MVSAARALITVAACMAAALGIAASDGLGFTTQLTAGLVNAYARQFGAGARDKIVLWVAFARVQKSAPPVARLVAAAEAEVDALRIVNTFFNRIPFLSDASHWGVEDYWATPAETVASNGGDCEDYSIAKYFLLKEFGVPIERLRITYVKAMSVNEPHMVLAYYATPGADPLILDNLEKGVRPASERADLVPVYSFNDEDVVLVRDARKGSALQIRAWRDLLQKLETEARL